MKYTTVDMIEINRFQCSESEVPPFKIFVAPGQVRFSCNYDFGPMLRPSLFDLDPLANDLHRNNLSGLRCLQF